MDDTEYKTWKRKALIEIPETAKAISEKFAWKSKDDLTKEHIAEIRELLWDLSTTAKNMEKAFR